MARLSIFSTDKEIEPLFEQFDEDFEFELEMDEDGGITSRSYWFNNSRLPEVNAIHDYLDSLPESGKVLSIASSLDEDRVMDDFYGSFSFGVMI